MTCRLTQSVAPVCLSVSADTQMYRNIHIHSESSQLALFRLAILHLIVLDSAVQNTAREAHGDTNAVEKREFDVLED